MALEPKWSPSELAIVDRHIEMLKRGRYRSGAEASRACHKELLALPASKTRMRRTLVAVDLKINAHKRLAGINAPARRWLSSELAVVNRFVEAVRKNRYETLLAASLDCRQELARLRANHKGPEPKPLARTIAGVHQRMGTAARKLNLTWSFHGWQAEERRVAKRFARAFLAGKYPSMMATARACWSELAHRSNRPRQFGGVYWTVLNEARSAGLGHLKEYWTPAEQRVLNRYLRLLFEGQYRYAADAARDCTEALGGSRSFKAVLFALRTRATQTKLPRFHSQLTEEEQRIVEAYALKVHEGKLPHWLAAAKRCREELQRRADRAGRNGELRLRRTQQHALLTIHMAILKIAHDRNLRGPRNPHWTEAEDRPVGRWVSWYDRYRLVRRLKPLKQAAESLTDELAEAGFQRTPGACKARLLLLSHRKQGIT